MKSYQTMSRRRENIILMKIKIKACVLYFNSEKIAKKKY